MNINHNSYESDHDPNEVIMRELKQLLYADETTAYEGGLDLDVTIDPMASESYGDFQRIALRYDTPDDERDMPEILDIHMYDTDDVSLFSYIVTRGDSGKAEVMIESLNSQLFGLKISDDNDLVLTQDVTDTEAQFGFLPQVRPVTPSELEQLHDIVVACRAKLSFPPTP